MTLVETMTQAYLAFKASLGIKTPTVDEDNKEKVDLSKEKDKKNENEVENKEDGKFADANPVPPVGDTPKEGDPAIAELKAMVEALTKRLDAIEAATASKMESDIALAKQVEKLNKMPAGDVNTTKKKIEDTPSKRSPMVSMLLKQTS